MPIQVDSGVQIGGNDTDYLFGGNASSNNNFTGNGGQDFLVGDFGLIWLDIDHTGNDTLATAYSIDNSLYWYADDVPFISTSSVPHTTIHLTGADEAEYFSVTVGAGQTITIDTDWATFDTVLQLLDSSGNELNFNDDSALDVGTLIGTESFLSYTAITAGTYIIRVGQYNGANNTEDNSANVNSGDIASGNETLIHVSVTGHAATGSVTAGDDFLNGGDGNDQLYGMDGNDILTGSAGADFMDGGTGVDSVFYFGSGAGVTVNIDTNAVSGGDATGDTISNFENIYGSAFVDVLTGNALDNIISGGAGGDTLDGGTGIDTLDYTDSAAGVTVNIDANTASGGDAAGDIISNFENIFGSAHVDVLTGNAQDNIIRGGAGGDTLNGGTGVDTLDYSGSFAGVTLDLNGNSASGGHAAGDIVSNFENVTGSDYNDSLTGNVAANVLTGGDGNDYIFGGFGGTEADILRGGDGNDLINEFASAHSAGDVYDGGAGTDTLSMRRYQVDTVDLRDATITDIEVLNINDNGGGGVNMLDSVRLNASQFNFETVSLSNHVGHSVHLAVYLDGQTTVDLSSVNFVNFNQPGDRVSYSGTGSNDTFVANDVNEWFVGYGGLNLVSYENAGAAVTVDLSITAAQDTVGSGMDQFLDIARVIGSAFDDSLTGNSDANLINGGEGNNTISGGAGDDTLLGGSGNDIIDGGDDIDTIWYNDAASGVRVDLSTNAQQDTLGAGLDTLSNIERIVGSNFDDYVIGTAGDNVFNLLDGNDTVSYETASSGVTVSLSVGFNLQDTLGAGIDRIINVENLVGSAFDDTLTGSSGDNVLDGGAGNDTVSYAASTASVRINLASTGQQDTLGAGLDTLTNFENVIGSAFNDTLIGDSGDNVLEGGAGDDFLLGGAGNDTASYESASAGVTVNLGISSSPQNTIGAGSDRFYSIENLTGSAFNDTLTGNSGDNILEGGDGNDTITGGGGHDIAAYRASTAGVTVNLNATGTQNTGGAGLDNLVGISGVFGSNFDDIVVASSANNTLDGRGGTDTLYYAAAGAGVNVRLDLSSAQDTGSGQDTVLNFENVTGSSHDDVLGGTDGDNIIDGGAGMDSVSYAGASAAVTIDLNVTGQRDTIVAGLDTFISIEGIVGSDFADTLTGDTGGNIIEGGAGADMMDGGDGEDILSYAAAGAGVIAVLNGTGTGGDAAGDVSSNFEILRGSAYGDSLTGDAGDNSFDGGAGDDMLFGLAGNDTFIGSAGGDAMDGGAGFDVVTYLGSSAAVTVNLATGGTIGDAAGDSYTGVENIVGTIYADTLTGDAGDNVIEGGLGNDIIDGGAGSDTVSYENATSYVLVNLASTSVNGRPDGIDQITSIENVRGSAFNDFLYGDGNANIIEGGGGRDYLRGEGGDDIFLFAQAGVYDDYEVNGGNGFDIIQIGGAGVFDFRNTSMELSYLEGITFDRQEGPSDATLILTIDEINSEAEMALAAQITGDTDGIDTLYIDVNVASAVDLRNYVFSNWDAEDQVIINTTINIHDQIHGSSQDDIIYGNLGHDTLSGNDGNDTIYGGNDNDTLNGNDGNDILYGEGGSDILFGGNGDDILDGGADQDIAYYVIASSGVTVDLSITGQQDTIGGGLDTLFNIEDLRGSQYDDILTGDSGNNVLFGFHGNDTLIGSGGNDQLRGEGGNDVFVYSTAGVNTDILIDGGSGVDTLRIAGDGVFDFSIPTLFWESIELIEFDRTGSAASTLILNAAKVYLGSQINSAATITGDTGGADTLQIDFYQGVPFDGSGYVFVDWDAADSVIFNGSNSHNDNIIGTTQADIIHGNNGNDLLNGFSGNDHILGGASFDRLIGGEGDDILDGGADIDLALYEDAATGVTVSLAIAGQQDTIGAGLDTLISIENLIGSAFDDTLTGDGGANIINGLGGIDMIDGGLGNDKLFGGDQNDTVLGGGGEDQLSGGQGNDDLDGGADDDRLIGDAGDDIMDGGAGNDTAVYTFDSAAVTVNLGLTVAQDTLGAGLDTLTNIENLTGSAFGDTLTGDAGSNVLTGGNSDDVIDGAGGTDIAAFSGNFGNFTVAISGLNYVVTDTVGSGGADTLSNIETLRFDDMDLTLAASATNNAELLVGLDTADVINALSGNDVVLGNAGDDTIDGGAGDDTLYGGAGDDTASYDSAMAAVTVSLALTAQQDTLGAGLDTLSGFEHLTGSDFNDTLAGDDTNNNIDGGDGTDIAVFTGVFANYTITSVGATFVVTDNVGSDGTDTLSNIETLRFSNGDFSIVGGSTSGDDLLIGTAGADVIDGLGGNDQIFASAGDDVLSGGEGDDVLNGGADNDTASYLGAASAVTVNLANTAQQNTLGAGLDTLTSIENLIGSAFNDILIGDGHDNIIEGGAGNDIINGGLGTNTVSYAAASSAVTVNTSITTQQDTIGAGLDTLSFVSNIAGSAYNDTLTGSVGNNTIRGGNGNDVIDGGGNNDYLYGGEGNDVFTYVTSNTRDYVVDGGAGVDTIQFSGFIYNWRDTSLVSFANLEGISFETTGVGTSQVLLAASQVDDEAEFASNTVVTGAAGQIDHLSIWLTTVTTFDASGWTLVGWEANDIFQILGSTSNDTLTGTAQNDILFGVNGNDILEGGGGDDVIDGGNNFDTASYEHASAGVTVNLSLTAQQDTIGAGLDTITFVENLRGSAFNDTLTGNAGINTIEGGDGNDMMDGGDGSDIASYEHASAGVTVDLSVTVQQNTVGAGLDTLTNFERLTGSAFNDTLTGDSGSNYLIGGDGNDTLNGGAGIDAIYGDAGDDIIDGGADFDYAYYTSAASGVTIDLSITAQQDTVGAGLDTLSNIEGLSGSQFNDVFAGTAGTNFFNGGAGIDTISYAGSVSLVSVNLANTVNQQTGGGGLDRLISIENLIGSNFNDQLIGNSGNNVINGGDGNDNIRGGAGDDTLDGGAGIDTANYGDAASGITIDLRLTTAQNTGGGGTDTLTNFENIFGSNHNDVFTGTSGDNVFNGYGGMDTVSYAHALAGITVDLSLTTAQDLGAEGMDTFFSIENIVGSDFDDVFIASTTESRFDGGAGIDRVSFANAVTFVFLDLTISGQQDTIGGGLLTTFNIEIFSGSSFDDILLGDGNDNIFSGEAGNDDMSGGAGVDTVSYASAATGVAVDLSQTSQQDTLGAGLDTLSGFENLIGSGFDDLLGGNTGNNVIDGGAGTDTVSYAGAVAGVTVDLGLAGQQDTIGAGLDTLVGIENLIGSGFDDTLMGSSSANAIDGGAGFDIVSYEGAASAVTVNLFSGQGNRDHAAGDTYAGIEALRGSDFNDILVGRDGASDTLFGGEGNDSLRANGGDDFVYGEGGNDLIFAGFGADTIDGGAGIDTLMLTNASAGSIVRLDLGTGSLNVAGGDTYTNIENVAGSAFRDLLYGDDGNNFLDGRGGDDLLIGNGGADILDGGNGFDTVSYANFGAAVSVSLFLGRGPDSDIIRNVEHLVGSNFNDLLVGNDGVDETLDGGDGADSLRGNGGNDTLNGGNGNDILFSGFGNDIHDGGAGFDTVTYAQASAGVIVRLDLGTGSLGHAQGDTYINIENITGSSAFRDLLYGNNVGNVIDGRGGNDLLIGNGGSDTLIGGNGFDKLDGGTGFDVLTGGAGDDTFVFKAGYQADRITDFTNGDDLIDLTSFGFTDFAQVQTLITQQGADAVIIFGGGDALRLAGVDMNTLDASDFVLSTTAGNTPVAKSTESAILKDDSFDFGPEISSSQDGLALMQQEFMAEFASQQAFDVPVVDVNEYGALVILTDDDLGYVSTEEFM